jgi:signal transduction histidine kinase
MINLAPAAPAPLIAVISNAAISRLLSDLAGHIDPSAKWATPGEIHPWRTAAESRRADAALPSTGLTREELFERVERAKREWESTVDSLPDLVCLVDRTGKIIRANRIVEEWNLGRVEAVGGQTWHELLHPDCPLPACYLAALSRRVIEQVIQGEPLDQVEYDPQLNRHLHFHAHPVLDHDQLSTYTAVIVVRDVSEQQRVEHERERLIADLDAYAHTVAHDLKNPAGLVIGYSEYLSKEWQSMPLDEILNCLQTVARVGHKLNDIIDELLLFAEVQDSQVEVRPLDMGDLVAEALDRVHPSIEEYQAEVSVPDTWPAVIGYRQWIEEVWVNYLSNALKYGGRPPRVELGSERQPDGAVRFWVRDNGNGLAPADQAQVFKRFARAGSKRIQGHGLGLSIVQRIIEKLGGTVGVESSQKPGEGCTFYFVLPAANE